MRKFVSVLAGALALAAASFASAQNQTTAPSIAGTWQGTLQVGKGLRIVLHVSPDGQTGLKGELISVDQAPTPIPLSSISLTGTDFSFAVSAFNIKYHGALASDGNSIKGTFNQGGDIPLELDRATAATEWKIDASPHKIQFITVDKDVKLEVLDWGGQGRPLVLLAGLGSTGHAFDQIAPKLAATFHVFAITRRGFAPSSIPDAIETNYSAQRLGDDVLAAIHQLKLEKPIVAGHSIAGEELSYIGTRHPQEVAGLIYLDAGYPYAFYDAIRGDASVDSDELRRKLDLLVVPRSNADQKKLIDELLTTDLPAIQKDLVKMEKDLATTPDAPSLPSLDEMKIPLAVIRGETKFSTVKCPVLAIFASPHDFGAALGGMTPAQRAAMEAMDADFTGPQIKAFQQGNPNAKVVVLAHASHAVFVSNEADVLKEINAFAAALK